MQAAEDGVDVTRIRLATDDERMRASAIVTGHKFANAPPKALVGGDQEINTLPADCSDHTLAPHMGYYLPLCDPLYKPLAGRPAIKPRSRERVRIPLAFDSPATSAAASGCSDRAMHRPGASAIRRCFNASLRVGDGVR